MPIRGFWSSILTISQAKILATWILYTTHGSLILLDFPKITTKCFVILASKMTDNLFGQKLRDWYVPLHMENMVIRFPKISSLKNRNRREITNIHSGLDFKWFHKTLYIFVSYTKEFSDFMTVTLSKFFGKFWNIF